MEDLNIKQLTLALRTIAEEKNLPEETVLEVIEQAIAAAWRRDNGTREQLVRASLNINSGTAVVSVVKTVVEEVENDVNQMSLDEAKTVDPAAELGSEVTVETHNVTTFGRVAAQTAKQVILQRLREAERGIVYEEYMKRSSEIVTGIVQRVEGHNVFVNIGRAEAVLMATEQLPNETYNYGDTVRAYIIEVKRTSRGPQIMLSRTHPGLLKKLFELQVPEIQEGVVEIRSIAREAGSRSKVAVWSSEERVDPIGACVGPHYMRVQAVVDELAGEKIDIVKWSDDPATYIANSLNPAKVISVAVNEAEKISRVVVPDYQLSLAIGKEGQNARLAAKLTGWKIDIKSETQAREAEQADGAPTDAPSEDQAAAEEA